MRKSRGFTMIELMVGIALIAIILALAAPSFRDFILTQRLKGTSSELLTDFQYARSEAVARGRPVYVEFRLPTSGSPMSCYTIYTDTDGATWEARIGGYHKCDCTLAAGSRCASSSTELRSQQIPSDSAVALALPTGNSIAFDPVTGGISYWIPDQPNPLPAPFTVTTSVDSTRQISTIVGMTGRPQNCVPSGASVSGYTSC